MRLDSKHEAATAFVESAKAFLKVDHKGTYQHNRIIHSTIIQQPRYRRCTKRYSSTQTWVG